MTTDVNNLENIMPIMMADIQHKHDDELIDTTFCIIAALNKDLIDISPHIVSDIAKQTDNALADQMCCVIATIDNESVNVSPLIITDLSNQIDDTFTDKTYRVVTTIDTDLVNVSPIAVVDIYDQIADALVDNGYYITSILLPETMTNSLYERVTELDTEDFHAAGIGRKHDLQLNQQIRLDNTRWLTADNAIDANYLDWMSHLRTEINQRLFMGLFKYEAHYAHYAPGAHYHRHIDAFRGESNRVLTTLLYLNPNWHTTDGGELLIYHPETGDIIEKITPEYGKFIVFLSERFPHQVLRTNRDRYSISGWFHINNS